jgi:hypothetical protein
VESISNHQWDPFDQSDFVNPPRHREASHSAAENVYDGNAANQSTKSLGQLHSFSSAGTDRGEQGTKEGQDQAGSSVQEEMNYDPIPLSNYHLGSQRERGYSDPFPVSNHQLGLYSGYSMHPAHQEVDTNQYYGSNVNQYAAAGSNSHPAAAAAAAGGYYYSQPHHSQQHDAHSCNMFNHDYWYGNHYYNNYYSAQGQGLVQGRAPQPPQGANATQIINYTAEGVGNHNSPPPDFSPR